MQPAQAGQGTRDKIRQLIELNGAAAVADAVIDQQRPVVRQSFLAGHPGANNKTADAYVDAFAAELTAQRPLLDHQRFEVLERYIQRRDSLPQTIRIPLGGSIAKAMGAVIANHPRRQSTPLDDLLAELYEEEVPRQSQAAGTNLQAVHLVRSQAATWNRCRELVDKAAGRGLRALDEKELAEFTGLYREVAADLAVDSVVSEAAVDSPVVSVALATAAQAAASKSSRRLPR